MASFQLLVEVQACGKPRPRNGILQVARKPSRPTVRSAGSQLPWKLGLAPFEASDTTVSRPKGVKLMPTLPARESGSENRIGPPGELASTTAWVPLPASADGPASGSGPT